ncbi:MAG: hypothetical protein NT091_02025 [Candidatus Falkowbacteria bacterium]|nr:hypothetical protein [Candidatus Falkowbacteria bacterium]
MLIATKITKKRELFTYGLAILVALIGSVYLFYNYYLTSIDLNSAQTSLAAYAGGVSDSSGDTLGTGTASTSDNIEAKMRQYFNVDLFYDPKFQDLKENTALDVQLDLGKRDPFQSFLK